MSLFVLYLGTRYGMMSVDVIVYKIWPFVHFIWNLTFSICQGRFNFNHVPYIVLCWYQAPCDILLDETLNRGPRGFSQQYEYPFEINTVQV